MMFDLNNDTIAAPSSPGGRGAIAVIRMSGSKCLRIIKQIFSAKIDQSHHRKATIGNLFSPFDDALIDQVVVTYYKKPKSYTGEDVIEISCHGNPLIVDRILNELSRHGCRMAKPGEFTQRAFLNQKIDLSQAEAVANIIDSKTRISLKYSLQQLSGELSRKISDIRCQVMDMLSLIEVNLDFNDDEADVYSPDQLNLSVGKILDEINLLLESFEYGNLVREGVRVAILGKPNVGKSSLLNALLNKNRAIVHNTPGTTRDYLEEQFEVDGIPIQLIDTAGIRKTEDKVEYLGVNQSLEILKSADLAIAVFEACSPLDADDKYIIKKIQNSAQKPRVLAVANKIDLKRCPDTEREFVHSDLKVIPLSAKTRQNLDKLKSHLKTITTVNPDIEMNSTIITNARHRDALKESARHLKRFQLGLSQNLDEVVLAIELRGALNQLGLIVGTTYTDDILDHIFTNFCVGK